MSAGAVLVDPLETSVLAVPGAHCAGCMSKIERGLAALPQVASARVNLTSAVKPLLAPLGVAGFACMNVMLLSVSVWSARMGPRAPVPLAFGADRLPAIAYAGPAVLPSAWAALKHGGPTWTCRSRSA
jgi:P-type Cu2+ transporter